MRYEILTQFTIFLFIKCTLLHENFAALKISRGRVKEKREIKKNAKLKCPEK